jgi:hypothetical protein
MYDSPNVIDGSTIIEPWQDRSRLWFVFVCVRLEVDSHRILGEEQIAQIVKRRAVLIDQFAAMPEGLLGPQCGSKLYFIHFRIVIDAGFNPTLRLRKYQT